ncbi:MAG: chloride channel protein [Odoribacteraceae bacterium]|jgi:CIC family chloride channel protein|nr:chloride channel protein [Odoribacteraceae bacterium]
MPSTDRERRPFNGFLIWRARHVKERPFIVILSVLVGLVTGLAAVLMKNMVHVTRGFVSGQVQVDGGSLLFFVYPLVGILLTWLFVKYFVKEDISHGVTKVLFAISRQNSMIKPHNNYSSMIASTLTIGFGGSVGMEATIVLTGASIGSNLARFFRMNYKTMTLMVGCGAAGAVSGIFEAPIAGIMFTLEVLLLDLTLASLVPLMLTAITSYVIAFFFMGDASLFSYRIVSHFEMGNFFYYVLLGLFSGILSVYFIRANLRVERFLKGFKNPLKKMAVGGVLLGLLIFIFPPFYGEGYSALDLLMDGDAGGRLLSNTYFFDSRDHAWVVVMFVICLVLVKVIATALTNGSGGVGGVFAPSLFTGGLAGYLLYLLLGLAGIHVPASHFVLAGMAGVMAGVMAAPLTAMFLIAEVSGGYSLLLPLMLTSVISYLTSRGMEPHSIYARRLALKGDLLTHNKDKAVLTLMKLEKVVETDFQLVDIDDTLGDLVKVVSRSSRNLFPVLDKKKRLLGIVLLDDIRKIMFNQEMYATTYVRDFMTIPDTVIDSGDSMDKVMKKFEESGAWNLPVLHNHEYLGFVSKAKIFNTYRRVLIHFSDDE